MRYDVVSIAPGSSPVCRTLLRKSSMYFGGNPTIHVVLYLISEDNASSDWINIFNLFKKLYTGSLVTASWRESSGRFRLGSEHPRAHPYSLGAFAKIRLLLNKRIFCKVDEESNWGIDCKIYSFSFNFFKANL